MSKYDDFGTLILAARMAHITAAEATVRIYRDSAGPIRVTAAGVETIITDETRATIDRNAAVSWAYTRGCSALASTDMQGVDGAVYWFREALRLAGVPDAP